MGFWTMIGLASYHDLQGLKEEIAKERMLFQDEMQAFLQEQHSSQEREFENLKVIFKQSVKELETKTKEETSQLASSIHAIKSKVSDQLFELKEQGEGISAQMGTVQEIMKIHWASTLLDYIDELLEEAESDEMTVLRDK